MRKKSTIWRTAAASLFTLTCVLPCFTSGVFARYSAEMTGTSAARAADFVKAEVELGEGGSAEPGQTVPLDARVAIDGTSETAFRVNLDVTVPRIEAEDQYLDLFTFSIADGWIAGGPSFTEDGRSVIYHYYRDFDAGSDIGELPVFDQVEVPLYSSDTAEAYPANGTITVTADAQQLN